uniref:protein-tyrosine-phosphatase n=1 Tax=Amphimedon queenslandica TaxID=400682 RepID=A0A1X7TRJ0_AMPQE
MSVSAFHHVSRVGAEELLLSKGTVGSFLTRRSESDPKNFTLSVRQRDGVTHVRIQHDGEFYDLYGGEEFASLPELLHFYTNNPGALKEKNGKVIEITKPLPREDMSSERWYHADMSGKDAELLLLAKGQDGSYIVRTSMHSPGNFVLSTRVGDEVSHVKINHKDGSFQIDNGPAFRSLNSLIDYYKENDMVEVSGRVVSLRQAYCTTSFLPKHIEQRVEELRQPNDELFGKTGFEEEYQQLQHEGTQHLYTRKEAGKPLNRQKNRFKNILPFDHTRVVLAEPDSSGNTYINANYVNGEVPGSGNYYIATQGCLPGTINDFWSMVWQEDSKIIVMITNEIERGKNKCARYWPSKGETTLYGNIQVINIDEIQGRLYVFRKLHIEHVSKKGRGHYVVQYQFKVWPDHGVPQDPSHMLDLMDDVNRKALEIQQRGEHFGPMIVHCSAGVGRTGTYIVVDIITKMMEYNKFEYEIDVQGSVQMLRHHRSGMVQTEDQYRFLYYAIKAYIERRQSLNEALYVNVTTK